MEPTVSLSISRKVALPNYENADVSMTVHNVEVGATKAEIEEYLATGDTIFELMKPHIAAKMRELKAGGAGS